MNNRQNLILNYFLKKNMIALKKLSNELLVSERTLRNDIVKINEYLEIKNYLKVKKGIIESEGNISKYNLQKSYERIEVFNLDSDMRLNFIKEYLLINNKINISRFSKENYLSRGTVKSDIEKIKEYLKNFNIEMTHTNEGIKIMGEELEIRKQLISDFNLNNLKRYGADLNLKAKVENILEKLQIKLNKMLQDESYNFLRNYLIITYLRNINGLTLTKVNNKEFYKGLEEYSLLKKILSEFISNDLEIIQLLDFFIGMNYKISEDYQLNYWLNFHEKIKKLVKNVDKKIGNNLIFDEIFLEQLNNHMKPAIYRIKNNLTLKNSIYKDIINSEKKLFEIIKNELKIVENFIGIKFTNDEIAFIVMHFKVALDRSNLDSLIKKKIIVVCNYGLGTSRIFSNYLEKNFEVEILAIIPYHRLEKFEQLNELDSIITTVELSKDIEEITRKNIIKISPIMEKEDFFKLEKNGFIKKNKIKDKDKEIKFDELYHDLKKEFKVSENKKLYEILEKYIPQFKQLNSKKINLKNIINSSKVNIVEKVDSWEEAIDLSCLPLIYEKSITKEYVEGIKKTIKKMGAYMIIKDYTIIPHYRGQVDVFKTDAAFLFLKNSVTFPGNQDIKILFSFCSKDGIEHTTLLSDLVELISDEEIYKEFLSINKNKENLLKIIKKDI